jgi:N-acetyl-anhydromuramyl-L-alanine amidase AmpD
METFRQSPNISRQTITPKGIVLHHTVGSYNGSVEWCLNPASKVSYHCIVNTDGTRTVLALDNQRAWHAGVSSFKGQSNCNDFMLGVAVSGNTNQRVLTQQEINSVAQWCVSKMKQHNIPLDMITTHATISPGRKNDVDSRAFKAIIDKIKELL